MMSDKQPFGFILFIPADDGHFDRHWYPGGPKLHDFLQEHIIREAKDSKDWYLIKCYIGFHGYAADMVAYSEGGNVIMQASEGSRQIGA